MIPTQRTEAARTTRAASLVPDGERSINPAGKKEWCYYEAHGALPPGSSSWKQVVDILLAPRCWPLYCGITGRFACTRWSEHYAGTTQFEEPAAPKQWAPRVRVWVRKKRFATEEQALRYEEKKIKSHRFPENGSHNGGNPENRWNRARTAPPAWMIWRNALGAALLIWVLAALFGWRLWSGDWADTWEEFKTGLVWSAGFLVALRIFLQWQSRV